MAARTTSKYVDGFLLVVPKKNLAAYKKMARGGAKIWKKHGALDYMECIGDDLSPNMGGMRVPTFLKLLKIKPSETVVFSYITFQSRAHRDRVNKKVMADPNMQPEAFKEAFLPFDMKRMYYGGYSVLVSA